MKTKQLPGTPFAILNSDKGRNRPAASFTPARLPAVIAIISVLAALLLPVPAGAVQQGNNAPTAQIVVNINGMGTVKSNYNGDFLQIGTTYHMTASAAAGFKFTNWTGSITTNNPTLTFVMASNLSFTANFVDAQKPALTVTAPTAGERWSNATFTASGKASDNVAVSNVLYQLNGGAWTAAYSTNQWTNWTAAVTLIPDTNIFRFYAVDTSGNLSATNTVSFIYALAAPLTVGIVGNGTVSPNYNGRSLQIGQGYSMTATHGTGFKFTNWTGSVTTTNTTLSFVMASNLSFTATFLDVTPPTDVITYPAVGQKLTNDILVAKGGAKDNVGVAEVYFQLNGSAWNEAGSTNDYTNWFTPPLTLSLGTNTIGSYAVDPAGNKSPTNKVGFSYAPVPLSIASVSSKSPTPLTPLTITPAGVTNGVPISVTFSNSAGFLFTAPPIRVSTNGNIIVAVPLYVDPSSSTVTNGTVSLLLTQGSRVSAPLSISIQNLPAVSSYGTKLGQISHSHFVFQANLLGRELNELEAAQLLFPGVDTSHARSTISNLLRSAILARNNVDAIMLNNSAVITNGFLPNGTPVLFDRHALDMMDRVLAVHWTGLAGVIGLSSATADSRKNADIKDAASGTALTLKEILEIIETGKGVLEVTKSTQEALNSGGALDTILAVTGGANSFLGLALGEGASLVSAQVGGVLSVASTLSDVTQMSIDLGFIIKESYFGNGNPDVLQAAYQDINNLQTKTFIDATSTALAAEGVNMAELEGAATAWQLAGGTACSAIEYGWTAYELAETGVDQSLYNAALSVGAQIGIFPSANQGFAQWTGTAVGGSDSGDTSPQSSLDLCCFGAGADGIQGITDSSGDYDLFFPLGVPDTDYGALTLTAGDFITGTTWGSETVNLSGVNTSNPVQVPGMTPPVVYYTLSLSQDGTGTGKVTAKPSGLTYVSGTVVTVTAAPSSGSEFEGWSGDASGTANSVQLTMNSDLSVTATFDNTNDPWSGTWNSTQNFTSSSGDCSEDITATISLNISFSDGEISGSGTENGPPCFSDADCSVLDVPNISGDVSGSASGNTISIEFDGYAEGGSCDGDEVSFSFNATLVNSTTISGTTGSGRAFTYTKQ
jgi:hypothetical protein